MVGLNELGEMAWQCEQVMNKWLHDEKPASSELLGFIDLARVRFSTWVEELKQSGAARIDGADILRQAERLKTVGTADSAAEPTPIPEAPGEAAREPEAPAQPEVLPAAFEEATPVETLDSPSQEVVVEPVAATPVERPESEEEVAAELPQEPSFALQSRDLAPAPEAAEAEPDVVVGPVSFSAAFFAIYLNEAREHVQVLDHEMSRIEADALIPVSDTFMRAAHTLAMGSKRWQRCAPSCARRAARAKELTCACPVWLPKFPPRQSRPRWSRRWTRPP